jgi:hypothetical protein
VFAMILSFFKKRPAPACFISYPKSGRTWVRHVLRLAGAEVKFTHAGHGTAKLKDIGNEYVGVKESMLREKNIFLHRNALDTAVSLYFQIHRTELSDSNAKHQEIFDKLNGLGRLPPTDINDFVLHKIWGCEQICKFNRGWCEHLNNKSNIIVITYEDIKNAPELWFTILLNFLEVKDYDLNFLVMESSFQRMRKVELEQESPGKGLKLHGLRDGDPDTLKVRRGIVKGYFEYLRPETIDAAALIAKKYGFDI